MTPIGTTVQEQHRLYELFEIKMEQWPLAAGELQQQYDRKQRQHQHWSRFPLISVFHNAAPALVSIPPHLRIPQPTTTDQPIPPAATAPAPVWIPPHLRVPQPNTPAEVICGRPSGPVHSLRNIGEHPISARGR